MSKRGLLAAGVAALVLALCAVVLALRSSPQPWISLAYLPPKGPPAQGNGFVARFAVTNRSGSPMALYLAGLDQKTARGWVNVDPPRGITGAFRFMLAPGTPGAWRLPPHTAATVDVPTFDRTGRPARLVPLEPGTWRVRVQAHEELTGISKALRLLRKGPLPLSKWAGFAETTAYAVLDDPVEVASEEFETH